MRPPTYRPEVFEVESLDAAKHIILQPDGINTTDQRWAAETPWLATRLGHHFTPTAQSIVLDYGCGIGRVAKPMIERFGCTVIGVDASDNMRLLATHYMLSERFIVVSPAGFDLLLDHGLRCDHGYSVWVLQHCAAPDRDIARIRRALRPGGSCYVVNAQRRAVPSDAGWHDDGRSIDALLGSHGFAELATDDLPPEAVPPTVAAQAFAKLYRRNPD